MRGFTIPKHSLGFLLTCSLFLQVHAAPKGTNKLLADSAAAAAQLKFHESREHEAAAQLLQFALAMDPDNKTALLLQGKLRNGLEVERPKGSEAEAQFAARLFQMAKKTRSAKHRLLLFKVLGLVEPDNEHSLVQLSKAQNSGVNTSLPALLKGIGKETPKVEVSTSKAASSTKVESTGGAKFGVLKTEVMHVHPMKAQQVMLWQILEGYAKGRNYKISVKHSLVGEEGAFYITAWRDTDGDSQPDKEIGISKKQTALKLGQWSEWSFSSIRHKGLYVGLVFKKAGKHYYQMAGKLDGYVGLSDACFFKHNLTRPEFRKSAPRYTNIRVEKLR